MAQTRSNRRGDWTQLMSLRNPPRHTAEEQRQFIRQLAELNALPTVANASPNGRSNVRRIPPRNRNSNDLLDTSMYDPTETPSGFGLALLPHQKRGLTWMLTIEDTEVSILVNSGSNPIRVFGGIVADKPGTGKSVLMIALIKSNPCRSFFMDHRNRIRSKATLLLCPRNIIDQWANEIRRCDPALKILAITTINILRAVSCLEVALADVIIMPYYLLAEPGYMAIAAHIESLNPPSLNTYQDLVSYQGVLSRFQFHRIVYDEVHEIYDQSRRADSPFVPFMENFHSNWRWGLTGTPPREAALFDDVLNCISRADLEQPEAISQLKAQIVRSNNPDLGVPPAQQKITWIDLSAKELAVYNLFRNSPLNAQLMACSHFNVNDIPIHRLDLDEGMTIDQVSAKLQRDYKLRMDKMSDELLPAALARVPRLEAKVESLRDKISRETNKDVKEELRSKLAKTRAKLRKQEGIVSNCRRDIPRLATEIKYFSNIISALKAGDEQSCPICLDDFADGIETISLTACGHAFCVDCLSRLSSAAPCSICRAPIPRDSVMTVKLRCDSATAKENADANNERFSTFGSKINQLVLYIGTQSSIDSSFKFIIFVQYSKLATLIVSALRQYGIGCVNLAGTVAARGNALKKFEKEDIKVLLMSSEQSVSGANIIAASHVIILHPVNLPTEEESIAAEKQGVARACRFGQQRSVQVVRFVTRGTVEEKITRERMENL